MGDGVRTAAASGESQANGCGSALGNFGLRPGEYRNFNLCRRFRVREHDIAEDSGGLAAGASGGTLDFVPVLGFLLVRRAGSHPGVSGSPTKAGFVVGLYAFYHLVENYWIAPKVYGGRLRLSNVATRDTATQHQRLESDSQK